MKYLTLGIFLLTGFTNIQSARILGIIPTPAYSHQSAFHPIWKALAKRGHDLVVVTTDPMDDSSLPNLKEIDISFTYEIKKQKLMNIFKDNEFGFTMILKIGQYINATINRQLEEPTIQGLIHNKSLSFDLVMYEYLSPMLGAFAYKFNCPSIGLLSLELSSYQQGVLGNPQHPAVSPLIFLPSYKNLNFYERLQSAFMHVAWPILQRISIENVFDEAIDTHFGRDYPRTISYAKNVDMVFANANNIFKIPTPIAPNVIEFGGGVHIREPKPLPSDIGKFLNSSKSGVIYFSLGSSIKSDLIDDKLKNVILEAMMALPYDVLWKFEEEIVKDNPKIKFVKWAPQQDILRHSNVKVFITQCGLQSLEEALYSQVPIIGLPLLADQFHNARMVENLDIGKIFDYKDLKAPEFKQALVDVASDPKYKTKMVELARISRDRPMSGIDSVVWWTEYVIRNNGAKHLRSVLVDLPWYQYYMLDVLGSITLVVLIILYILYKSCKLVYFCCKYFTTKKVKTN